LLSAAARRWCAPLLGVGRHGVLEVEDQRIGRQGRAFSSARVLAPGM
jgi:hypothetical protein